MATTASGTEESTESARSRPGPVSKIAGVLIMLVGAGLVAMTVILNLFAVGPAFENLIGDFRPALTQQSIDTAREDIAGLSAVQQEFTTKLAPALSQQLQMTPPEFDAFVTQQFPAVAKGMSALPTVVPTFNGLIDTLDQQRTLFASADAIPTSSLPATTVPWGMLGAGVLVFLVGVAVLAAPKTGGAVAVVVGLLLLVLPILMSLPQKAADADQLNANLEPVYTQTLVDNATGALGTVGAMGQEMQTAMLPALAEQLKMSPTQLQAFLGSNFPATAQALQSMPGALERFNGLVKVFDDNLANYETLKPVGLARLIWIVMIAGGVVAVLGAVAVATGRRG